MENSVRRKWKAFDWEDLSDDELLQIRIRDLKVQIPGSSLQRLVDDLDEELDAKGIGFHPDCYLADEWLTPENMPTIGIPFYLAHPRLRQLEKRLMYDVEGGTERSCMRLLRHECGHALNYAYGLYRRTRWRELFGSFSAAYSDSYDYQPYSRRFVSNLRDNYAQSHPEEDFAETFAVWLNPASCWQEKYRGWPALKKLHYVDHVMRDIGRKSPRTVVTDQPPYAASRMTSTLAAFYERRRRALGSAFQGFYDDSLEELFAPARSDQGDVTAGDFLRSNRARLVNTVARWTGHRKFDIDQLIGRLINRCNVLGLCVDGSDAESLVHLTAFLTAIASNTLTVREKGR
jgi:hypothetical protein